MYVNQITNFNAIYYCLDYLFIIVIAVIIINKILDKTSSEFTCLQMSSYRFFSDQQDTFRCRKTQVGR